MKEEILRGIVSSLSRVDRDSLTSTTPLSGALSSSLGRARLDAALRAQSFAFNPVIYRVKTYGELCEALGLGSSSHAENPQAAIQSSTVRTSVRTSAAIQIGIDIEPLASLPEVQDYWEDMFYQRIFTNREIAYALLQSSPRASFGVIWCAKEAARKANPALLDLDWHRLEVIHDANGRPNLAVDGEAIEGALSLSHTEYLSFAAFISTIPAHLPSYGNVANLPLPLEPDKPLPGRRNTAEIIAVFALLVALTTLILMVWHH
jgi:phosphopantetheine--protein transferase-like protein